MSSIARVQKQNTASRRLHDLQAKALKKVVDDKIQEINRFIREIKRSLHAKHIQCNKCERQMDSRRTEPQVQRVCGSSSDKLRTESRHACECDSCTCNKPRQCRRRDQKDRREEYCSHHKHGTNQTLLSTRCDSYEDQETHEKLDLKDTSMEEPSNKNITAFMFSRHCRHGYDMKKTTDNTEMSMEYARKKIRAKVVKNYLLQDVFKRLSSTRSLVVKNRVVNSVDSSDKSDYPDTVQTLSQCRYLRVPQRQTVKAQESHEEGNTLTNVDGM